MKYYNFRSILIDLYVDLFVYNVLRYGEDLWFSLILELEK